MPDATTVEARILAQLVASAREARNQARWDACVAIASLGLREAITLESRQHVPDFLNLLGGVAFQKGEMDQAAARFGEALRLVVDDPSRRAAALVNLGAVANVQGRIEEAIVLYRRGRRSYRDAGNELGQARALHNMGMLLADQKRWHRSEWCYRKARDLGGNDPLLLGTLALNVSEVHLQRGELARAIQACDEASERLTQLGARPGIADAHRRYGEIHRRRGDAAAARRHLRIAARIGRGVGSPLPEAEALRERGALEADAGDYTKSVWCYGRAFRLFRSLEAGHELADSVLIDMVDVMGREVERSDPSLFGHSSRVAQYAAAAAGRLGLDDEAVKGVLVAGYLHDIGMLQVDPAILAKPGLLTAEERAGVRLHAARGARRLERFDLPWDIASIVRAHHEEYDGSGYPDAVRGRNIPLGARILHVADVYDALTASRPWRPAWTREAALDYVADQAGRLFDPYAATAFLATMRESFSAPKITSHREGDLIAPAMSFREALRVVPLRSVRAA